MDSGIGVIPPLGYLCIFPIQDGVGTEGSDSVVVLLLDHSVILTPCTIFRIYFFQNMDDNAADKIKSYHDEAFRYINQALTFDEKGDTRQAFLLYNKGLRQLILGANLPCRGAGPKFDHARKMQEKMKLTKDQVEERVSAIQSSPADADVPQKSQHAENGVEHQTLSTSSQGPLWEDVNELLVLEDGVKMFFVSELGNVTTLSQPQTLRAYQFVKYEEGCSQPPAFLQCSGWIFPMVPKRSPVLNTEPHTYMFPDITINLNNPAPQRQPPKAFASVGLIINPHITSAELKRFERILECYTDFNRYTPTAKEYREMNVDESLGTTESITHVGEGRSAYAEYPCHGTTQHGSSELAIREPTGNDDELGLTWGDKISMGIAVAAEAIAWGLVKGAEAGTHIVHQGGVKIRSSLKPNETPTEVDEKVQQKIRHVKTVAGVACQVSSTVVSAVAAMTRELARSVAPVVVEKGGKMLPEAVKKKAGDEKGQIVVQNAVKVAVGGAHGFATVYEGLEKSWKLLYKSLQHATVKTVDHKYGAAVGEATDDSLGALGYALQTWWNVDNLGVKALAKRTAKETGKELIGEAEKKYLPPADDQQRQMQQMNGHK